MSSALPAPEILFAQHLAANEKVHRDRALRKLQKYIFNHSSLPNGGFNEAELLKIWKGLHYCMWMQDKPLIQEELSDNIANLIHAFNNAKTALLFIKCFYITECREWLSIDKWRMDKFLMMFRNMLTQSFEFLKKKNWSEKLVREFLDFISKYILHDHGHDNSPDGVRFHFADTYLVELEKVTGGQLGPKQTVTFLQPWIGMLPGIKCTSLRAFVIKNIFGPLMQESSVITGHPRKKGSKKLRVNYRVIADKLLEVGSSEECTSVNRSAIYNLVQNFRDIGDGKLPFSPENQEEEEEVSDLDDDDIENAVKRLAEFKQKLQNENEVEKSNMKKRKKSEGNEDDEAYGSGAEEDQSSTNQPSTSEPLAKKKKQSKDRILSKKLQKILKAEEEYMAEDDEDISNVDADESDVEMESDEEAEDSEGSFDEGEDDLLYADDSDDGEEDNVGIDDEDDVEEATEQFRRVLNTVKESSSKKKSAKKVKDVPIMPATASSKVIKNSARTSVKTQTAPTSHVLKASKIPERSQKDSINGKPKNMTSGKNSTPTQPVTVDATSNDKPDNRRAKKKKQRKEKSTTTDLEFEVEDFPEADNDINIPEFIPSVSEKLVESKIELKSSSKKAKRRQSLPASNTNNSNIVSPALVEKVTQALSAGKKTRKFAEFVSEPVAKAKYFRKAMSNSSTPAQSTPSCVKTPVRGDKKRLSFGKISSVEKMTVKLRGSKAHDPTKTPEQSILKVNPIQPGTLIQVGKQATLANTLKNSKFPHRMMAMDFF